MSDSAGHVTPPSLAWRFSGLGVSAPSKVLVSDLGRKLFYRVSQTGSSTLPWKLTADAPLLGTLPHACARSRDSAQSMAEAIDAGHAAKISKPPTPTPTREEKPKQ